MEALGRSVETLRWADACSEEVGKGFTGEREMQNIVPNAIMIADKVVHPSSVLGSDVDVGEKRCLVEAK